MDQDEKRRNDAISILSHSTLIPAQNIRAYVHIYSLIRAMNLNDPPQEWPKKKIDKINETLDDLRKEGWIDKDGMKIINQRLSKEMSNGFNFDPKETPRLKAINELRPKGGGRFVDWPKHFIIYALVSDSLYHFQNKPNYAKISDFLSSYYDFQSSYEDVEKAYLWLKGETPEKYSFGSVKGKWEKLDRLLKLCREYTENTGQEFIPSGTMIKDIPDNYLTQLAHYTGFKESPFLPTPERPGRPLRGK